MNQEAIELLETINTVKLWILADWLDIKYKDDPAPEVQADLKLWADNIDKALTLLKQQPAASEFTEKCRELRSKGARLDSAEAINKDLLEACEYTELLLLLLSKGIGQTTHALALIEAAKKEGETK